MIIVIPPLIVSTGSIIVIALFSVVHASSSFFLTATLIFMLASSLLLITSYSSLPSPSESSLIPIPPSAKEMPDWMNPLTTNCGLPLIHSAIHYNSLIMGIFMSKGCRAITRPSNSLILTVVASEHSLPAD